MKTFMMIKPDAVERGLSGKILAHAEEAGLKVVAMKMVHLSKDEAGTFYEVHAQRPFYDELTTFMSRSPIVAAVLEGDDAVKKWRDTMGATNPADADAGTIRALYAQSVGENSVHGSDSPENAGIEIEFFGLDLNLR